MRVVVAGLGVQGQKRRRVAGRDFTAAVASPDAEIGQVMNYLRIAKLELGIILNFRRPKLESRRVALSD